MSVRHRGYAIEVVEVVASSMECLAYYSYKVIRFLIKRAMVVDSCAYCNSKNIVNKTDNINLDYRIKRHPD